MEDEDTVVAEYDVVLNPSSNYDYYLMQYVHRPANRPHGDQVKPLQGKIKMSYSLNTDCANYDRSAAENRIKTHNLEGTPVPLNTNYCVGKLDKRTLVLTPIRTAVQLRTTFDHVDKEYEERRRKGEKEEEEGKEVRGKVKMQLKKFGKPEEESEETQREKALLEQYEKEEWRPVKIHPEAESKNILHQLGLRGGEFLPEWHGQKTLTPDHYLDVLTAGMNDSQNLPMASPESRPFLTDLQKNTENLHNAVGELFQRQHVIPFTFIREFLPHADPAQLLDVIKNIAVHVCRGIFAINSDRVFGGEKNVAELRRVRNAVLELLRKSPSGVFTRDSVAAAIGLPVATNRALLDKVLPDVCDKVNWKWQLRFVTEALEDFSPESIPKSAVPLSTEPTVAQGKADAEEDKEVHAEAEGKKAMTEEEKQDPAMDVDEATKAKMAETITDELRRQGVGVMNYEQIESLLKHELGIDTDKIQSVVQDIIAQNCVSIGNAIILAKTGDPSIQILWDAVLDLLKRQQIWGKKDLKDEVDTKLGKKMSETQFTKVLKELCNHKAKKWYLKCYDN